MMEMSSMYDLNTLRSSIFNEFAGSNAPKHAHEDTHVEEATSRRNGRAQPAFGDQLALMARKGTQISGRTPTCLAISMRAS
eukprot:3293098-Amphidinium_carterae.2